MLSFKNEDDRMFSSKYYTPTVEIKDFNVLIDDKNYFSFTIQNKQETYEENIEVSKNNNYTTENLLVINIFQIIIN